MPRISSGGRHVCLTIVAIGFGARHLLAVLEPAEGDLDGDFLATTDHDNIDRLADRAFRDNARQIAHCVDRLAVKTG
jgi:hypothetical protein